MGSYGASCFRTFSGYTRDIEKAQWDKERFGQVCGKPEAYADLKAALLKLCKKSKACSYEDIKKIQSFGKGMIK